MSALVGRFRNIPLPMPRRATAVNSSSTPASPRKRQELKGRSTGLTWQGHRPLLTDINKNIT